MKFWRCICGHPGRAYVILQEDVKRRIEKEIAEEAGEAKP
jgi:rod shape-determining protein MreC